MDEEINSADNDDLDINFFDLPTTDTILGSLGICKENVVSVWTSQSGLQFHATRKTNIVNRPHTPLDLTPSPRSASVQINIPQFHDIAAFCSVSGRLCYLRGHADNTIYIADCLFRNLSETWFILLKINYAFEISLARPPTTRTCHVCVSTITHPHTDIPSILFLTSTYKFFGAIVLFCFETHCQGD